MSDELVKQKPDKPWLRILFQPRETIRTILDYDPMYGLKSLLCIYTMLMIISALTDPSIPFSESVSFALLQAISNVINILLAAWITPWAGKLLGGSKIGFKEALCITIWPFIILSYAYLVDIPSVFFLGKINILNGIAWIISIVWGVIISLVCVSEALNLSKKRAWLVFIIQFVAMLPAIILYYLAAYFIAPSSLKVS